MNHLRAGHGVLSSTPVPLSLLVSTNDNPSRHAPSYHKDQGNQCTKQDCASPTTLPVRFLGKSRPFVIITGYHLNVFLLQKRQL
jgi:hypothetical protein